MLVCNRGCLSDVHNDAAWIGDAFRINGLGVAINLCFDCIQVIMLHKAHFPAKLLELPPKLCHRSSVQLRCGNKIVAGLQQV